MVDCDLMTAQAVARALDLSVETIWRYTREQRIPFIELGGRQYRYRLADVVNALAGRVSESSGEYRADVAKKMTYEDYLELPDEPGYRFEVLDGLLVKELSANVPHQRVSRRLQRLLEDYFWVVDPEGEVFDAPLDLTIGRHTVVQPDLFYVAGHQRDIVQHTRVDGAPTLVVEILSPSSGRKDRLQKMRIYQNAGIEHYWLVDPDNRTMECFCLSKQVYSLIASGMDEEELEHPLFSGLKIKLSTLW